MQVGYEYPSEPGAVDDHTTAAVNFNNHITLSYMKIFWAILTLSSNTTDFFT